MQKHLSSLFTGIMLALFAFCLAIPTFGQADTTPEWRERATAETELNAARYAQGLAFTAHTGAVELYNDLVQNWNNSISSAPGNILSLVASRKQITSEAAVALAGLVSTHLPANEK